MKIVAFTGKRGHGKSTAAEALVREHGYVHLNFADTLRDVCNLVYRVSYEEMMDPVLKETPLTRWPYKAPRELLQQIGTEMFRNYIEDTWIENWSQRVYGASISHPIGIGMSGEMIESTPPAGVVCSDCRFLNEAKMIKKLGGILIKIEDPRKVRTDAASLHQSETEIDLLSVDGFINNNQGIAELEAAALEYA